MNEEEFCKAICILKDYKEKISKIEKFFEEFICTGSYFMITFSENLESNYVKILAKASNLDYDMLEYFIYELDFGKKYKEGCYIINGKSIDLSTPENLFKNCKSRK